MHVALFAIPFATSLACGVTRRTDVAHRFARVGSALLAIVGLAIGIPALLGTPAEYSGILLDRFAGMLVSIIAIIQWTATLVSIPYLRHEEHDGTVTSAQVRIYHALVPLFSASMLATAIADNIGFMWVALEATTLATTLLVAFYTHEGSLEAAWKYLVLCSVGISLGLLGVLLTYFAATSSGALAGGAAASWTALRDAAGALPEPLVRLAFVLIFVGYGAKVGLVPMHMWLPDAHGRTPSPVSGMLSGVLLMVAFGAVLRFKAIADGALGSSAWTDAIFRTFGFLTFALPAAFLLIQRNYKRLFAYSSIEHMGLATLAVGLGPIGVTAAMLHLTGHAFAKSLLFFGSGNLLLTWKSTKFANVTAVIQRLPITGVLLVLGMLAILAVPPSSLFASEFLMLTAGFASHPVLMLAVLLVSVIIFAGMTRTMLPTLIGVEHAAGEHTAVPSVRSRERWNGSHVAMVLHLVVVVLLGLAAFHPVTLAFFRAIAASVSSGIL